MFSARRSGQVLACATLVLTWTGILSVATPQADKSRPGAGALLSRSSFSRFPTDLPSGRKVGLITGTSLPGVYLLDPDTNAITGPILSARSCAAISPDGMTGVVPDSGGLAFIDLSDLANPVISGTADVAGSWALENLCLDPPGRNGIVSGTFYTRMTGDPWGEIASFHVPTRSVHPTISCGEGQSPLPDVAIAADGETVIVVGGAYGSPGEVYLLDPSSGRLTFQNLLQGIVPALAVPKRVAISPDGRTAILGWPSIGSKNASLSILRIDSPGRVTLTGTIRALYSPVSLCFSPDGKAAYAFHRPIVSNEESIVQVYDVTAPGAVVDSGIRIPVAQPITAHFGNKPDIMAVEPQGRYLYLGGPVISVFDLKTNTQIASLASGAGSISFPRPSLADVGITKSADRLEPYIGEEVTFTVAAGNNGPRPAPGVRISDLPPAGLTILSHEASAGTYDPAAGLWDVGDLALDGQAILTVRARVDRAGAITNSATLAGVAAIDYESSNDRAAADRSPALAGFFESADEHDQVRPGRRPSRPDGDFHGPLREHGRKSRVRLDLRDDGSPP